MERFARILAMKFYHSGFIEFITLVLSYLNLTNAEDAWIMSEKIALSVASWKFYILLHNNN
jgi:hypothetical protein